MNEKQTEPASVEPKESEKALEPATVDPGKSEKALEHFKDWSNYLLVTTVAALGWVASGKAGISDPCLRSLCLVSFGGSAVFGMLTLALIPLIAEQYHPGKQATDRKGVLRFENKQPVLMNSFYDVFAKFNVFNWKWACKVKYVCFFQHTLFILGIVYFVIGTCLSPPNH
jgi:hypothetical protein